MGIWNFSKGFGIFPLGNVPIHFELKTWILLINLEIPLLVNTSFQMVLYYLYLSFPELKVVSTVISFPHHGNAYRRESQSMSFLMRLPITTGARTLCVHVAWLALPATFCTFQLSSWIKMLSRDSIKIQEKTNQENNLHV